jgi:hypothetical protein
MSLTQEQQHQYIESAKRELLCLVDEHNNVLGSVAREQMRKERLWHRSTFIFVQSSNGKFYVQVILNHPNNALRFQFPPPLIVMLPTSIARR